jgi:hypothetical protein
MQINNAGMFVLGVFALNVGVGLAYLGALCFSLPYVLVMSHKSRLSFRTIIAPTAVLSLVYGGIVYASLVSHYSFAGTIAVLSVPAVILSGFSFYLISVWSPLGSKANRSQQHVE